jgi:hypothetical protein
MVGARRHGANEKGNRDDECDRDEDVVSTEECSRDRNQPMSFSIGLPLVAAISGIELDKPPPRAARDAAAGQAIIAAATQRSTGEACSMSPSG